MSTKCIGKGSLAPDPPGPDFTNILIIGIILLIIIGIVVAVIICFCRRCLTKPTSERTVQNKKRVKEWEKSHENIAPLPISRYTFFYNILKLYILSGIIKYGK